MKKTIAVLSVLGLLLLWLSSLVIVPAVADWLLMKGYPATPATPFARSIGTLGAVGDLFGAVNALFSALALGAVALTLWLDVQSRRRARRPLVICNVTDIDSILIRRPILRGRDVVVPFSIPIRISNATDEIALNIEVECEFEGFAATRTVLAMDHPLQKSAPEERVLEVDLLPAIWTPVLDRLTRQEAVMVRVAARYRNLEDVEWKTEVTYEVRWRSDPAERQMLNSARGGTWAADWGVDADVSLAARVAPRSWKHQPA